MFDLPGIGPFDYVDPWALDYPQRMAMLVARKIRIAYYYERADTSTFRYRVFNMVLGLAADPDCEISASWFVREDIDRNLDFVDRCDVLVIARTRMSPAVDRMIAKARRRGLRVLFDIDDFVFNTDYAPLILDTLAQDAETDQAMDTWYAYFSRLGATLKQCDGAIVTNEFLASKIRDFCPHLYTRIIPNFLNDKQQALSISLYEAKKRSGFRSNRAFHIGYFSGSPTHLRDFAVAAPALRSIMELYPRSRLVLVGFLEPDASFGPFIDRIDRYPLQDFMNLQRLIAQTEINIAPLQDNEFTNCKSELKYFEAAITGTITVATPTYTFRRAIVDGENSLLATAQQWEEKLGEAVEILLDRDAYADMAEVGQQHAIDNYRWDGFSSIIQRAVFETS